MVSQMEGWNRLDGRRWDQDRPGTPCSCNGLQRSPKQGRWRQDLGQMYPEQWKYRPLCANVTLANFLKPCSPLWSILINTRVKEILQGTWGNLMLLKKLGSAFQCNANWKAASSFKRQQAIFYCLSSRAVWIFVFIYFLCLCLFLYKNKNLKKDKKEGSLCAVLNWKLGDSGGKLAITH